MYWYDENDLDLFYKNEEEEDEYWDEKEFYRENYRAMMLLDRKLNNLEKRIEIYQKELLETPKDIKIKRYLKNLQNQRERCQKDLYYYEDELSGFSK